jgi:hypothetical protein
MATSIAQAKLLCTAPELKLVTASTRSEIGKLSTLQLEQKIKRSRALRDKWRDQSRSQRRAVQSSQRARQTDANARSAEKAELFGEVLARFEAQLNKLTAKGQTADKMLKRLSPRTRSATHRATRAEVRDSLKEQKANLSRGKKPRKSAATAPEPSAEEPTVVSKPAAKPAAPAKTRGKGKKSHAGVGLTAIESARELQGLHVTQAKQLRARTAAKQSRLKASGLVRIQKNASAQNKRRQAKRDSR